MHYSRKVGSPRRIYPFLARYPERTGAVSDIAFVPTMGALHAGHAALIRRARELSDDVVVSIFVNPLQFENPDDLNTYPHTFEADSEIAYGAGATSIWAPTVAEMYPEGDVTPVRAGHLGEIFEGATRAGHFDGVLTVVERLFNQVKPRYAIFGEKDFQQLTIIKSWVAHSKYPVEIIAAPIVRDSDGVALSSRNVRLGTEGRAAARAIPAALKAAVKERSLEAARTLLSTEAAFTLDYLEFVDESTLESISDMNSSGRFLLAGWVNGVRLIDNMAMGAR